MNERVQAVGVSVTVGGVPVTVSVAVGTSVSVGMIVSVGTIVGVSVGVFVAVGPPGVWVGGVVGVQ